MSDSSHMNEKDRAKSPALVPQPHGGALRVGNPGNVGGAGRPPSEIREKLRGSFAQRIGIIEELADDKAVSPSDRLKALDMLGKYGLGKQVDADDVRGRLRSTLDLLERELGPDHYRRLYPLLKEIWK